MLYRTCCFLSNEVGYLYYTHFTLEEMKIQNSPERAQEVRALAQKGAGITSRWPGLFCVFSWRMGSKDKAPSSPLKEIWAHRWEAVSLGVSDTQEALERLAGQPLGSRLPCIPRRPHAVARRASGSLINHSMAPRGDWPHRTPPLVSHMLNSHFEREHGLPLERGSRPPKGGE